MSDDSTQQVEQKVTAAARQQTEQDQQVEECIAESDGSDRCRARPVSRVFDNTINFRCRAEVGQERPLLVWLRQQVQALSRGQLVNVKSEVRRWTPGFAPCPRTPVRRDTSVRLAAPTWPVALLVDRPTEVFVEEGDNAVASVERGALVEL